MFKKLCYGQAYEYYELLDTVLLFFEKKDVLLYESVYGLKGFSEIEEHLIRDGMVVRERHGLRITVHGKSFLQNGGYKRRAFRRRLLFALSALGVLAGLLSLLV